MSDAALEFQRRGAHRRLAGRDFFQSLASAFDGDDDDDGPTGVGPEETTPTLTSSKHTTDTEKTTTTHARTTTSTTEQKTSSTEKTSQTTSAHRTSSSSSSTRSSSSSSQTSSRSSSSSSSAQPSTTVSKAPLVTSNTLTKTSTHTTHFVTSFAASSSSPTITGAAAAASTSSASSSVSAGVVIGGVAAGIVGVAGLVFAALFFIRRKRTDAPLEDFDPHTSNHQSVILPDDGMLSRASSVNRNYNEPDAHSLSMEQTVAAVPPSFGGSYAGYGADNSYYGHPYAPYQNNYGPGQYMSSSSTPSTPYAATPTSATPFMHSQSPYGVLFQAPGTPVTRQPSNGAGQYFNGQPSMGTMQNVPEPVAPDAVLTRKPSMGALSALSRQPSTSAGQALSRQPSMGTALSRPPTDLANAGLNRQPSEILKRQYNGQTQDEYQVGPDAHYVDLNRSSVTPFQAQQYSEISQRLNMPPPGANAAPPVAKNLSTPENPAHELASPFADPEDGQEVTIPGHSYVVEFPVTPQTEESFGPLPSPGRFAAPPTPKYEPPLPSPAFGHDRVPSTPPILPEIHLQERPFSPVAGYPIAPVSAQPSATFDLPSPLAQAHLSDAGAGAKPDSPPSVARPLSPNKLAPARAEVPGVKRPDTVYSMAPDEDAYDGI